MSRRKVSTTVYLEQEQLKGLAELSRRRRVPMAALIRGSIDELLEKDAAHQVPAELGTEPRSTQPHSAGVPSPLQAGALGGGSL